MALYKDGVDNELLPKVVKSELTELQLTIATKMASLNALNNVGVEVSLANKYLFLKVDWEQNILLTVARVWVIL